MYIRLNFFYSTLTYTRMILFHYTLDGHVHTLFEPNFFLVLLNVELA